MLLSLDVAEGNLLKLEKIISILNLHCSHVKLRRHDTYKNNLEAIFFIRLHDAKSLNAIQEELVNINRTVRVSFMSQENTLM